MHTILLAAIIECHCRGITVRGQGTILHFRHLLRHLQNFDHHTERGPWHQQNESTCVAASFSVVVGYGEL